MEQDLRVHIRWSMGWNTRLTHGLDSGGSVWRIPSQGVFTLRSIQVGPDGEPRQVPMVGPRVGSVFRFSVVQEWEQAGTVSAGESDPGPVSRTIAGPAPLKQRCHRLRRDCVSSHGDGETDRGATPSLYGAFTPGASRVCAECFGYGKNGGGGGTQGGSRFWFEPSTRL